MLAIFLLFVPSLHIMFITMSVDLQQTTLNKCPACNSNQMTVWRKASDRQQQVSKNQFTYVRCRMCQSLFLKDPVIQKQTGFLYPTNYSPYFKSGIADPLNRLWPPIRNFVSQLKPGAVLDYGCGDAEVLDGFKSKGWDTWGLDFNDSVLQSLKSFGHKACDESQFHNLTEQSFDLVRMNHSLEHLPNPVGTVSEIFRILRPNGYLLIALPNSKSLSAAVFGANWWGLDCPRHLVLFSPAALNRVLQSAGFKSVRMLMEPSQRDIARSIAEFLRHQKFINSDQYQKLIANKWHLRFCKVIALFSSWIKMTDRIQIIAQK